MATERKTKICKHCSSEIKKNAAVCPYCHESQSSSFIKLLVLLIVVFLFLLVAYLFFRTDY